VGAIPEITAHFSAHKSITLHNFPVLSMIDRARRAEIDVVRPAAIYAGGLMPIRGIREIIEAMDILQGEVELLLLGRWLNEEFRNECVSLSGWRHTNYLGFVDVNDVYGYLKLAQIGLVTLYPQQNYLVSMPVKAFEYMACSLPMVMSDFTYWRKLFDGAAIFVDPKDASAIAGAVDYLVSHPDMARQMGERGRQMVEERYSWEAERSKLLTFYDKILGD
ncbi:MAG: glycosyltransferase family 4 protein, partial [Gammaproteobacteria bacterium]|nr:glycosyltransferase family 4 protein [Gammaproteobacteria bacterium]